MNFILWNADPTIFTIPGLDREIRWYGLLFAIGFWIGSEIIKRVFKLERKDIKLTEPLLMYMIVGTIVGARLGHVFFYGPYFDGVNQYGEFEQGYLSHPLSIFKVWEGGLASHGAGIGLITAIFLFYRKNPDYKFIWLLDRIAITIALAGCLIRFGNFMNSEIIGTPSKNGVVFIRQTTDIINSSLKNINDIKYTKLKKDTVINNFSYPKLRIDLSFSKKIDRNSIDLTLYQILNKRKDQVTHSDVLLTQQQPSVSYKNVKKASFEMYVVPRHPSQLYESISCLILFVIMFFLYNKLQVNVPKGLLSGIFFVVVFSLRFLYEYIKENQVAMEDDMLLNMGQKLSIPMVLFGIFLIVNALTRDNKA